MIRTTSRLVFAVALFVLCMPCLVGAQTTKNIKFDSFTGVYHLSRDKDGVSLLTTEEAIVAEFPGETYTGISRSIPQKFQGHPVEVKILHITNAAGTDVPYTTKTDQEGNLLVVTGDPGIILFGVETIKIAYQTTGVIDISGKGDNFLLNVNGRGWNSRFNRVDAILHIPKSFAGSFVGQPTCYTALGSQNYQNCTVSTDKSSNETIISAQALDLLPNQALLLKTEFRPSTFTNKKPNNHKVIFLGVLALVAVLLSAFMLVKEHKSDE